jgi:hypothetical protein
MTPAGTGENLTRQVLVQRRSGSQSLLVRVIRAIRGFNGLVQDEVRPPSGKTGSAREDAKARRSQNRVPDGAAPSWNGRRSGDPTPEAASSVAARSRNAAMSGAFEEWDQRFRNECGQMWSTGPTSVDRHPLPLLDGAPVVAPLLPSNRLALLTCA